MKRSERRRRSSSSSSSSSRDRKRRRSTSSSSSRSADKKKSKEKRPDPEVEVTCKDPEYKHRPLKTFKEADFPSVFYEVIDKLGFTSPTPIQSNGKILG